MAMKWYSHEKNLRIDCVIRVRCLTISLIEDQSIFENMSSVTKERTTEIGCTPHMGQDKKT
jgi:hypothetical protein